MKKIWCHSRGDGGFTLVELILSMALGGILLAVTLSYLGIHLKAYRRGNAAAEVQYEAQLAIEYFVRHGRNSTGFDFTRTNNTPGAQGTSPVSLKTLGNKPAKLGTITFKQLDGEDGRFTLTGHSFRATRGENEISGCLRSIVISPLPEDRDYEHCEGLTVSLTTEINHARTTVVTAFYFRNK